MAKQVQRLHVVEDAASASQAVEHVVIDNLPSGGGTPAEGSITNAMLAGGITADKLAAGVIPTVPAAPTDDTLSGATDTGKKVMKAADAAAARTAIGAGTSSFSGSYNDLANKPTIPGAYTLPAATTAALGGVKKAAAVASVASADAASAAAETVTKAEFDMVVAVANETKKQLNALLAAGKAAGFLA